MRLFDLADLRRFVGTTTDKTGHFALPLQAFSTVRGTALPTDFALGNSSNFLVMGEFECDLKAA